MKLNRRAGGQPADSRQQLIDALRDWEKVTLHTSMHAFLQFAKEHGLSVPQMGALISISHRGACGVTDIGDELGVTSAAASQMLERLVQGGVVERHEDPSDRRAKRIALTERGSRLVRESMEIRLRQFADLADRLSRRERFRAAAVVRTLAERSSAAGGASAPARPDAKEHPER